MRSLLPRLLTAVAVVIPPQLAAALTTHTSGGVEAISPGVVLCAAGAGAEK